MDLSSFNGTTRGAFPFPFSFFFFFFCEAGFSIWWHSIVNNRLSYGIVNAAAEHDQTSG